VVQVFSLELCEGAEADVIVLVRSPTAPADRLGAFQSLQRSLSLTPAAEAWARAAEAYGASTGARRVMACALVRVQVIR
jgi:hypothetical protein